MAADPRAPAAPDAAADDTAEETPLLNGGSGSGSGSGSGHAAGTVPDADPSASSHKLTPIRGFCVALSVWLLIFIQSTNMSGMTIIQGTIAQELQAYGSAMWFTTAYLIPMSSLAPLAGRLATIFAPRSLVLPISLFVALGALVTSRARSFAVFILGRVLTGVGGAGVLTLSLILVLDLSDKKSRGLFIGLVNAGFTVGVSIGAVVYGALLPAIGWRPLFWIQIPLSLVAGAGVYLSIPTSINSHKDDTTSTKEKLLRIDYLGASLLVSTIVLFLYGLAGDIQAWPLLASLGSLGLFLAAEYLVAADPIIPLKVLSSRGALLSCLAQLGLMTARWSVLFYSPVFMLAVRGAHPAAAGSVLIPTNLGFGLGSLVVGWLHVRRAGSFWLATVLTILLFVASQYALSAVARPDWSMAAFIVVVLANGATAGAALNYTLAHLLHLSHPDTQYITTSLLGTFRGFGGSFGTSIGGGIFYRLLRTQLTSGFLSLDGGDELSPARQRLVSRLLGTPELVFHGGLSPDAKDVAVEGYAGAIRGVWQAMATLGLAVVLVQALTGWKAPAKEAQDFGEEEGEDEDEARANVTENEGLGEA